jgi:hypothetical protein
MKPLLDAFPHRDGRAQVLERIRKHANGPDHPMSDPASAAALLAGIRGADPVSALNDLCGWLESVSDSAAFDEKARSDALARLQDAGVAHVSALIAQYLSDAAGKHAVRESKWKPLSAYLSRLTQSLCASAEALIVAKAGDASWLLPGAESAARSLGACRTLAKVCLVHYLSAPPRLWRLAYSVHARAEKAGVATTPVSLHSKHKTATTVTQELLRLLMLQMSAPEMLAPEQIEVADRVLDQLDADFTLRPPGAADNPYCFDPGGDSAPRRATGGQAPDAANRYFGPGMAFDALDRIHKQLAAARIADIKIFGKDISPSLQIATVQHLLMFWGAKPPYVPPVHAPATGELKIVHSFSQVWRQLSSARRGAGELTLETGEDDRLQAPQTCVLRDAGGNELGADIPQSAGGWARSGEVVGVSLGGDECWLGIIRRMHAGASGTLHADIAILSRAPRAVSLRTLVTAGEDGVFSEASSRQFAFSSVRAIIVSDGSDGSQKNLLLPPESWKEGRVYEAMLGEPSRYICGQHLVRRGNDYVRATFDWVSAPQS